MFYTGLVKAACLDTAGLVIVEGRENPVTPLENFQYSENIEVPSNTDRIELRLYSAEGTMIGILDGNGLARLTGIHSRPPAQVSECRLYQNYPNPFNAEMAIPFSLKTGSHTELVIYNMAGEKQCALLDDFVQPGSYTIRVNADEWPSGLYYYELRVAGQNLRKKCLLIK